MGKRRPPGVQWRVTGPDGATYLIQGAPSGVVRWSPGGLQTPSAWVVHKVVTRLVNRLVFRGGWTAVVWRGDKFAPKRATVWKQRYRTEAEAVRAVEELRAAVPRSGPPVTPGP